MICDKEKICNKLNNILEKYHINKKVSPYDINNAFSISARSFILDFRLNHYVYIVLYHEKKSNNTRCIHAELNLTNNTNINKMSEYRELAKNLTAACNLANEINESRLIFYI